MAKLLLDKRKLTALALAALLLVTSATYAATTGGGTLPITSGSSLTSGGVAEITALNEAFTIVQGKTQKISGIEVCRADLGSTTIRDQIKWHVTLLNPQDMGQVLNNPNSWIQIEVVYRVSSGEDYTLSTGELVKVATLKESVNNHMTRQNGDMLFQPEMGGDSIDNDTYWLLASIMVPGGAPPGQQSQIGSLNIVCNDVRL